MESIESIARRQAQGLTPTAFEIQSVIHAVMPILDAEPNVLEISRPVCICGDSHGQLRDVNYLFEIAGGMQSTGFLFLGDYVDRGANSVELITLFLCYKVLYPDRMFFLRGNHEARDVNCDYGFYDELQSKLGGDADGIWELYNDVFDRMPLAAIVDHRLFCVHGGLSPGFGSIDEIRAIERRQEPTIGTPMSDLLWSDPACVRTWQSGQRRTGYLFGEDQAREFLDREGLAMIVRAHEEVDGFSVRFGGRLGSVWAAPNYSRSTRNRAAFLRVIPGRPDTFVEYGSAVDK